jgi:hypothetical protein
MHMKSITLLNSLLLITAATHAQDALVLKNGANITVQNGAVVTVKGNFTLENGSTLTNQGIIYIGNGVPGNFTDLALTGGGNYGSGRFIFNGTGNQTIKSPQLFSRLEVNGNNLELQSNILAQQWYLQKGTVNTGSFLAIATDGAAVAIEADAANPNFSQGWINGTLRRRITPATVNSYQFPVGSATQSRVAALTNLTAAPLTGLIYIDINSTPKAGTDAGLLVAEEGTTYVSVAPEAVWNISANAAPTGGKYDLQLYINGLSGITDNSFGILQRPVGSTNGAAWTRPAGSTLPANNTPGKTVAGGYAARYGITTLGQFGIGLTLAALPVTLTDFRALRLSTAMVQLDWETASEQNNKGFDVERRWQSEVQFRVIGFVSSLATGGNSTQPLRYRYSDPNNYAGVTYYRLKQTDLDNRSSYTLIKAVKGTGEAGVTVLMWPNPNKGQFSIRIDGNTKRLPAFITDMNGKTVQQLSIYDNTPVNVYGLSAGAYIVSIPDAFGPGEPFREKVLVVK